MTETQNKIMVTFIFWFVTHWPELKVEVGRVAVLTRLRRDSVDSSVGEAVYSQESARLREAEVGAVRISAAGTP